MVQELLELASGVSTFDLDKKVLFALHAYLVAVFGDIPAMSMIMRMKGHNGIFPCRMCMIKGVRAPHTRSTTHYVPLNRENLSSVLLSLTGDDPEIAIYDAANLPLRTHSEFLRQAHFVQFSESTAEEKRRSKACGIKGIPLLSYLPSLSFPVSFPYDFMHLIWENLIPNLIRLWTGKFKGLDEGMESYELRPGVWQAIGKATKASGSTIPSAYGGRPQDVSDDGNTFTADSWSFWTLYIGPVLLQERFINDTYYDHFIKLVKLLTKCLQFEMLRDDIALIRSGFEEWVTEFER
ncbi:hypothetical protein BDN70DRAFT_818010 [Pholiota conissans]|uniref:Transposase n=1 Tax=Pholiota conissans TaxID=109636 RepID=A0A9P5YQH7_9AGAR|nr:hypothetical protein BDN70DRAFT_818010 [Pholiota conissans]